MESHVKFNCRKSEAEEKTCIKIVKYEIFNRAKLTNKDTKRRPMSKLTSKQRNKS